MVTVLVNIRAKEGQVEGLKASLAKLLAAVEQEPGCRGIHWGPVLDDADRIAIVERYADMDALVAHQNSTHMADLGPAVQAFCAEPPSAVVFEEA